MFSVVHAQISSTNRVLRSAWTGVSRGDCIFPFAFINLVYNGQVYLVNPNGIAITPSGTVNVGGGFVASTLGISDHDFLSGKRTFTGNGSSAAVSNAGRINVGRGGF